MLRVARKVLLYLTVFVVVGAVGLVVNMLILGPDPTVLMYHGVGEPGFVNKSLNLSLESFEKQMAFFHRHRYHVISLEDLVGRLARKERVPLKTIVLTFDDGYENNYSNVFPVLKKYGFPATIFILTDSIGGSLTVNDKLIKALTASQMREMRDSGLITFGAHSRSHTFLPFVKNEPGRLGQEIIGSRKALEDLLGGPVLFFCYPKGGYDADVRAFVRTAGFRAAVTTLSRHKGCGLNDLWTLKRVKMTESCDNPVVLFFETSGFYARLKEASA